MEHFGVILARGICPQLILHVLQIVGKYMLLPSKTTSSEHVKQFQTELTKLLKLLEESRLELSTLTEKITHETKFINELTNLTQVLRKDDASSYFLQTFLQTLVDSYKHTHEKRLETTKKRRRDCLEDVKAFEACLTRVRCAAQNKPTPSYPQYTENSNKRLRIEEAKRPSDTR